MVQAGDVLTRRYRLCARAGSGGMGDVWQAHDLLLRRTVAIKVLRPGLYEQSTFLERFRREAQAIAALDDEGIVDIFDYGELDGPGEPVAYLVMPLVAGMPLSRRIAGWGNLSAQDTMHIVAQVADSLQSAHDAGIIHRDVKPSNILLTPQDTTVLVDFGVARAQINPALTATGIVVGTLTYMSPEQASGDELSPATDIYSLGAVAHECLTGKPPYTADTPLQVLSAHLQSKQPQLPEEVPEPVKQVVTRALKQFPGDRWASASEFASACRDAAAPRTIVHDALHVGAAPIAGAKRAHASVRTQPEPADPHKTASPKPTPTPARPRRGWAARSVFVVAITAVLLLAAAWAGSAWPTFDLRPVRGGLDHTGEPHPAAEPDIPESTAATADTSSVDTEPARPRQSGPETSTDTTTSESPEETTSSPQSVMTPDVITLSESDAFSRIEESGLSPSVMYEGEGEVSCTVIDQHPAAGDEVERGSTVAITVARAAEECPS